MGVDRRDQGKTLTAAVVEQLLAWLPVGGAVALIGTTAARIRHALHPYPGEEWLNLDDETRLSDAS